jgi:hypothetical protein
MRTKWLTVACAVLLFGTMMMAGEAVARTVRVSGSLTIAPGTGAPSDLSTALVGLAVVANPGFEKTITIHIPPFTLPIFIDGDRDDDDSSALSSHPFVNRRLDTTLVLTNTTASTLNLLVTIYDAAGVALATAVPVSVDAHATKVIPVSDLLP